MCSQYDFASKIADIPDYPEKGVVFKDITPLLGDPQAFLSCIDTIADHFADKQITKVIGAEARGFIIGAPVAYKLGVGFVPARKPNKLPRKTLRVEYELEYGTDILEIHADAITKDDVVLIVDDILATGGTATAKAEMCRRVGAKVAGFAFVLELDFLHGKEKLLSHGNYDVFSLVHVE